MNRTLIVSCSQSKKTDKADLPAIQRYNGPNFKLLRRYLNQNNENLRVYILSAKFGLIEHKTSIPYYDQKLRLGEAEDLRQSVIKQKVFSTNFDEKSFFINLGKDYLQVLAPIFEGAVKNPNITFASGSSGKRLAEMYDWLYGEKSLLRKEQSESVLEKEVFIQRIQLKTNEAEILAIVHHEISEHGIGNMQNYQSWFVPVSDLKISPKWLISRLTGLPVGKFHSDQARKALQKLGIKVQRV